jgi:putative DNA modification/repair radical SAM protein
MVNFTQPPDIDERMELMRREAAFDVSEEDAACAAVSGIKAPKGPPKVPKMFLSNDCVFDCAYCGCRRSNERARRYTNSPPEMAAIAVREAKYNRHGVFISSAVHRNPDYTEELMLETLRLIRTEHRYPGYVHAKIMPGTDAALIRKIGLLADRISVNIELPHSEGYATIAKQKSKRTILTPMQTIKTLITEHSADKRVPFARAGQTTQLMVGTMRESDKTIIRLAEALYKKYDMRRVYYSPFSPMQLCDCLPDVKTPDWRSHRIYQADRLMQLYGMTADEILPEADQNLDYDIDPKAGWALRNLGRFPVEVNSADYETLIRVPGIGITSAKKILAARRVCRVSFDTLRAIGVSLKHSVYFITANGKYYGGGALDSPYLRRRLWADSIARTGGAQQLTLWDSELTKLNV